MLNMLVSLRDWVDARLPIMRAWDTHMGGYYAPKNFNFWYFFGVLSLVVLVNQLLTGIWLTMMFVPDAERAFASVEYIMRDVDYGWIIRYMHSTGASAFFVVVYLHMFRALLYGSYRKPRELVWVFGMLIFFALMAEAFLGYILPWGQMSYWGAQVIVSLFGAIPVVGEPLVEWIRGDYLISGITLNRFFALHVVAVPIILLALVVLHLLALHEVGSNNPDGVEIKKHKDENGIPLDGIAFHPYYTVHDIVGIVVFLMVFVSVIFFFPEMGGYFLEHANFEEANALKTPAHIAPVWYFTPFYSVLRAVPDKLFGFIAFGASVAILFALPWLDRSPVKSIRYKGPISKMFLLVFTATFLILGVLGVKSPNVERTILAQICSIIYFTFFLAMPFWSKIDKCKPEPDRITMNGGIGIAGSLGAVLIIAVLTVGPLWLVEWLHSVNQAAAH
ncbi:Cytochrome b [BD1-7 clade bacterium]|uniref:Cytochrome b n=1 Tax=BD1-7 clade bacterium TaxID=2029982 RepID=A0A5S9N2P8_9GAMM|nr:Cytochrome b [BD1-7 clade bacterium]